MSVQIYDAENLDPLPEADSVEVRAYKKAWARLLSKVYEIDPFIVGIVPRATALRYDPVLVLSADPK